MFSIATVVEEGSDDPELRICYSTEELREKIALMGESSNRRDESCHQRQPSCASAIPTDNSCSSTDDFFIEDEDEEVPVSLTPFKESMGSPTIEGSLRLSEMQEMAKEEALVESIVPQQEANKEEKGELKTGIVFEASTRHFDRHNRFHKERPIRVTSIYDALVKAGLQERCTLFEQEGGEDRTSDQALSSDDASPEASFLNDEDFLRVHLPGYMQRYVIL
jgi:hypothetical protein